MRCNRGTKGNETEENHKRPHHTADAGWQKKISAAPCGSTNAPAALQQCKDLSLCGSKSC